MMDRDLFGEIVAPPASSMLATRFGVPPFSVLSARDGDWQERKRQWLALGIKSELGRGEDLAAMGGAIERREAIKRGGGAVVASLASAGQSIASEGLSNLLGFSAQTTAPGLNHYRMAKRDA